MRQPKVGDIIELVNPQAFNIYSSRHPVGSKHTVTKVESRIFDIEGGFSLPYSGFDHGKRIWKFADETAAKFKAGDRIQHVGGTEVATITHIGQDGSIETENWFIIPSRLNLIELVEEPAGDTEREIEVTERGGKHTAIGRAYHHFPPHAMRLMAETLHKGAVKYNRPYSDMNWKNISKEDHHNHALNHIFLALENGETEDFVNAALRGIMALEMHLEEKENG